MLGFFSDFYIILYAYIYFQVFMHVFLISQNKVIWKENDRENKYSIKEEEILKTRSLSYIRTIMYFTFSREFCQIIWLSKGYQITFWYQSLLEVTTNYIALARC